MDFNRALQRFGTVLGALAFVLPLTCLTSPPTSRAAFPGLNGTIAFISNRDGFPYKIYVMNADGTGVTQLTNPAARSGDEWPAWSPDGAKIAFATDRDGNFEIYVMNADGTGQTNLTSNAGEDFFPGWSPDGTKIAFTSTRDGNGEIYVMNADGSGQTRLTSNPAVDYQPTWSPDGTKIAFYSNRDGNFEIYVVNADGTSPIRLTNDPAYDATPDWSPDGTRIAFTSNRTGELEIHVMNADGTGVTQLTNNTVPDGAHGPSWSPDGTKIAFQNQTSFANDVFVMNADGTGATQLTSSPGLDGTPDWQPLPSPVVSVAIDIKPGSFPNSINVGSGGTVPVAILSSVTFDATTVDPSSVTLEGATVKLKGKGTPMVSFEDVNGDGRLDLIVHVSTEALQLSEGDTEAVLEGKTFGGTLIQGVDSVRIVP